jgi:type II secretory pathway pseudopilin PulG
MKMRKQEGVTLIVSLVMLVVLTLLVVSSIRTGTTNTRIAGNMQVKTEAAAAAQQAIEEVISGDFATVAEQQTVQVTMGAVTYPVVVDTPVCDNTTPIRNDDPSLDTSNEDDRICFNDDPGQPIFDKDGKPIPPPSKCNQQLWSIKANIDDANTGVRVTQGQGLSQRFYKPTSC